MGIGMLNRDARRATTGEATYCLVGDWAAWEWSVYEEDASEAALGNFAGSHSNYYAMGPEEEIRDVKAALWAFGSILGVENSADACRDYTAEDWERHDAERAVAEESLLRTVAALDAAGPTSRIPSMVRPSPASLAADREAGSATG